MTAKKIPFCTDDELLAELKKLGYNDVSPDVLEIMKDDLSQLISKDQYHSKRSIPGNEKESTSNSDTIKHRYSQKQFHRIARNVIEPEKPLLSNVAFERENKYSDVLTSDGEISKTSSIAKYKNTLKSYKIGNYRKHESLSVGNIEKLSTEILDEPNSEAHYHEEQHGVTDELYETKSLQSKNEKESYSTLKQSCSQRQIPRLQRNFSDSNKSPMSDISFDNKFSDVLSSSDDISRASAFDRYKNTFQSYKRNTYAKKHEDLLPECLVKQKDLTGSNENTISETEYQSSKSLISLDSNKMKRKVLRHRDGKSVITEEFLDIPSIFNSSYPETQTLDSSKSFSSDDLSWKSNGSTGSISAISPDASITPRSTFSLSSTRSLHSRFGNPRKKKNDPVAMYNYYKKFWNEFKPPGEKTHDKIRWAVRDKMLDYNL
ncbi:uncharacterized protein LOC129980513 [Argiope bruennichi]|uniref:Centriolar and ciliogenesis-associated protein HYLS1 C-terminal domain-containing protein n=1 Tax=Argiope bruennichi TaxID=94029 RepID=A0A8T0G2T6_ARGBR|nr:uncharacterized protein LOC129980513 [Argiope bruennichi]KAF8796758.1 hypothetical protein HNY73_001099 [Argiope bruennichi]